ncbi:MAG TPA: response regulator [Rhizomicrobium sp.]|nr:response regulator [Rhizomicrobium sp.]
MPASILVTEDEILVRAIAVEVLQDAGYEVREAGDGRQALDMLESFAADLLITDIQMPRMNGYQLAEEALSRWPKLKILLVTGYTRENEPEVVRKAGLRTLQKPFDVERLPGVVAELLARA